MSIEEPIKRRGGQTNPATERKRNNLPFRVRDERRGALSERAGAAGRSLSEHIERMLEDALRGDAVIAEIRALRDEIAPPTEVRTEFTVAGDAPSEWRPPQVREPLRHS